MLTEQDIKQMESQDQQIVEKWSPIIDLPEFSPIPQRQQYRRKVITARMLENTDNVLKQNKPERQQMLSEDLPANSVGGGGIDNYDPILISLVRRAMPNLVAYDVCGVQPMSGPTGLIFALRPRYTSQTGAEAFYDEVNTAFSTIVSGNNQVLGQANSNLQTGNTVSGNSEIYNFGSAMNTALAEALGSNSTNEFAQMAFDIDRVTVTAKTRALKSEYSIELAQDLKNIHGLDAETELANIMTAELLAEINREVIRSIILTGRPGSPNAQVAGNYNLDLDTSGRWLVEKQKGLHFQVELEANALAKATRRGKGNIVLCSSNVASALQMAGVLDFTPALNSNQLQVDDTGNTFAGVLNGRINVYIDPYAPTDYMVVGYKGASTFDAGLFYCPYVPLQMVRAVAYGGTNADFQPAVGFKTRYGMVANPFSRGATTSDGTLVPNVNVYYRRSLVSNVG